MTDNDLKILRLFRQAKLPHYEYCERINADPVGNFSHDDDPIIQHYADSIFEIQFFDDPELQELAKHIRADYLPSEWPDPRHRLKLYEEGEAKLIEVLDAYEALQRKTTNVDCTDHFISGRAHAGLATSKQQF